MSRLVDKTYCVSRKCSAFYACDRRETNAPKDRMNFYGAFWQDGECKCGDVPPERKETK